MTSLAVLFSFIGFMRLYPVVANKTQSSRWALARFVSGLLLTFHCGPHTLLAETTHSGWDCVQDTTSGEWLCKTDRARQEKIPEVLKKDAPAKLDATQKQAKEPAPSEGKALADQETSPGLEPGRDDSREPYPAATLYKPGDSATPLSTMTKSSKTRIPDPFEETEPEDQNEGLPSIAKQPGWACKPDAGGKGWNCNLVGPDPSGQVHPVSAENESVVGTATFDNREELIFRDMLTKIPYNPWDRCTKSLGPRPAKISKGEREKAPVNINADYSDIYDREIVTFKGNVDVTRADQRVLADQATYDTESETLTARGNVHYRDQDYSVYSDTAFINLDADQGKLRNSQFIYGVTPSRGRAKLAERETKSRSRYIDAAYTTCTPGNQDWTLESGTLQVDRDEGVATATNAWLEISGVPIAYVPYFEFPIDDRRKSGILNPAFGLTRNTGFDFTQPYYWNIAPDYDATIIPRIMTKRGLLLGGEFRYLTESSSGHLAGEVLPYDNISKNARGIFSLVNNSQITPSLRSNFDLNGVSDKNYLSQIGNTISLNRSSYIRSTANLQYNQPGLDLSAQLDSYQNIDPTILPANKPYRRLPQILAIASSNFLDTDGLFGIRGEQVYFQRNNTVTGHRTDLKPDFSWPIQTASGFLTPKVALDFTQYFLQCQACGSGLEARPAKNSPDSITRFLPLVSLDGGLYFDREFSLGGSQLTQTLEPRTYYLFVPYTNQDNIPVFDTSEFDFTSSQLFRDNRFNSADRIGDANQISVALTSQILDSRTGVARLDGDLGTIVYLADQKVQLTPDAPRNKDPTSSLIADLNGVISDELKFRSGLQWNPHLGKLTRGNASVQYVDEANRILNLSYRYRLGPNNKQEIKQADASLRWPLLAGLAGVGRMQYSLLDHRVLESFLGFEKESCCWRFRVLGRYWVQTNSTGIVSPTGKANTGIFLQVEFKGFASFGDKVDLFLENNIPGYTEPD
ncbi:MAG: LPS-assembly protein LptD [Methylococcales bacterium]